MDNMQVWIGVQNKAQQRLTEFCQEKALVIANTLFQQHKRQLYTCAAKVGEALYSQKEKKKMEKLYKVSKKNWELTVAQIMNSLLPNSNLN